MKIRKLNEYGCNEFTRYIFRLRDGSIENFPEWMLTHADTSEEIPDDIEIGTPAFGSRYEMGKYLTDLFEGAEFQKYIGDRGFWSWLGLYWFEQLCPLKRDKQRNASMPYNYVLSNDYKHRYRHAVYITWQLVSRYSTDSRFLLCKEMPVRGELIEQLMARQDILSMSGVMKLASWLYTNSETGHFKKGAASRKTGGCVSRFISFLQQLELTYDLYMISPDELQKLLPSEFNRFAK